MTWLRKLAFGLSCWGTCGQDNGEEEEKEETSLEDGLSSNNLRI